MNTRQRLRPLCQSSQGQDTLRGTIPHNRHIYIETLNEPPEYSKERSKDALNHKPVICAWRPADAEERLFHDKWARPLLLRNGTPLRCSHLMLTTEPMEILHPCQIEHPSL